MPAQFTPGLLSVQTGTLTVAVASADSFTALLSCWVGLVPLANPFKIACHSVLVSSNVFTNLALAVSRNIYFISWP